MKINNDEYNKTDTNSNNLTGLPSGFVDLDNITNGFQKSELIIISSRPSFGKSTFALTLATNMAVGNNIPVGFFSLEMSEKAIFN